MTRSARGIGISTHAPLAGRDRSKVLRFYPYRDFNPRAPCGARLCFSVKGGGEVNNFNPRAPCGARRRARWYTIPKSVFQPTRPLRGATSGKVVYHPQVRISTHAPLAGRDLACCKWERFYNISTHAPLAGRDTIKRRRAGAGEKISTHAPLAGRDKEEYSALVWLSDFNPRAPCGARLPLVYNINETFWISTHAPLAGRDG